jgi:hypothetical protein
MTTSPDNVLSEVVGTLADVVPLIQHLSKHHLDFIQELKQSTNAIAWMKQLDPSESFHSVIEICSQTVEKREYVPLFADLQSIRRIIGWSNFFSQTYTFRGTFRL